MNAVTFLFAWAVLLSWGAPPVIQRIAHGGANPRLGVVAWLVAVGSAAAAWTAAVALLIVIATHSLLTGSAMSFCLQTFDPIGHIGMQPVVASAIVSAALAVTLFASAWVGRRIVRALRCMRIGNREHAAAARIVGRPLDGEVFVVDAAQSAAYCVAGRRSVIVVTSAALERLDEGQLSAVIAHEQAHLCGRHHLIVGILNALTTALPRVLLMSAAARSVPPLLEMCADDAAVRLHGPGPLLGGLVAMTSAHDDRAEGRIAPAGTLAAAGVAVLARATRLAVPAVTSCRRREFVLLSIVVGASGLLPLLAAVLCY